MSVFSNPRFSLVFLTWNRKDMIRRVLIELNSQVYRDFEIIVIDNGSLDGTEAMLKQEFSAVKLVKSVKNLGVGAYNLGIAQAKGAIIILLDSDALLEKDALLKLNERFNDSKVSAVSLNIINHNNNESETKGWSSDTPNINGCAVAIRNEVLKEVGGYDESYFLYHNDLELATRILNRGYSIYHDKGIICRHLRSESARVKSPALFYLTRNAFFYYWKYYSVSYATVLSIREIVYGFSRAVKERAVAPYLKGLMIGIASIPRMLKNRDPVNKSIYPFLRNYLDANFREPLLKKALSKI